MSSVVMLSLQKQRTIQQIQCINKWYRQKEAFFKVHVPLQQILIKNLKQFAQLTLLRLKDIADIVREEKQIQFWVYEHNQKCLLMDKTRFEGKNRQWTNNIDRVCLAMSNVHYENISRLKNYNTLLESTHSNIIKEESRYEGQLNKVMKQLQKSFDIISRKQKQQTRLLGVILKESKIVDKNMKDSIYFLTTILKLQCEVIGEVQGLTNRNEQIKKLKQQIIINEQKSRKRIKQQLIVYHRAHTQIFQKGKNDDNVTGLITIMDETVKDKSCKCLNNQLLNQQQLRVMKSLVSHQVIQSTNLQLIDKYLSITKYTLLQQLQVKSKFGQAISRLSHKQWSQVSLAQGWVISTYTPVQIFLTFDNFIAIFSLQNELLRKIHLEATKVSKVEQPCLYLLQITKGFFKDGKQQYKLKFQNLDRMEQFKLFVENVGH